MSDSSNPSLCDRICAITIGHEGDTLDMTHGDPGNWTGGAVGTGQLRGSKFGVSAAAYPDTDIGKLTRVDADAIYRTDYFVPIQGDKLPAPLALLAFDAAVNNGVERSAKWLQAAAGAAQDGVIGPETLAAIAAVVATRGGAAVCAEMLAARMDFMARLPTWKLFGGGWSRRLAMLPFQAMALVEGH